MSNLKRKAGKIVTSVALSAAILGGAAGSLHADALSTISMPSNESFAQYVESRVGLNSFEKNSLIESEESKAPLYDKINELNSQIFEIEGKILKAANPIFEEIFAIKDGHIQLVKKMDANINLKQEASKTFAEYVNFSEVLTKSEKAKLIKDKKVTDSLYEKVDAYYQKAEKASANLREKRNSLREEIRKIDEKNEGIWDKLYK